jgi:outer membrane receptor for ferric coprogen and ferric-rhodotorulic acid
MKTSVKAGRRRSSLSPARLCAAISVTAIASASAAFAANDQPTPVPDVSVTAPKPKPKSATPAKKRAAPKPDAASGAPAQAQPLATPVPNPDGSTPASGGFYVEAPTFGPFGNIPDKDIPFSTTTITKQIMDDQQVHSANDALKNDSSINSFPMTAGTAINSAYV